MGWISLDRGFLPCPLICGRHFAGGSTMPGHQYHGLKIDYLDTYNLNDTQTC